jgi:mono/diheme cytochrome c family protein
MKTFLKWTGRVVVGVVVLVVVAAGVVYGMSERGMRRRFVVPEHRIVVRADSAAIREGHRLFQAKGCIDCHGDDLTGRTIIDDPAVGKLSGPNLTLAGRGAQLTDADWERAVRHGVRRDGSALIVMPAQEYTALTDEDLAAIVAFARSTPPAAKPTVPVKVGPVARALYLAHQLELVPAEKIDHRKAHLASIVAEPTPVFGRYLVTMGCTGCHGPGLSGGKVPGTPPGFKPAGNITPRGIGSWSESQFIHALRTGERPNGTRIDEFMPIKATRMMTDIELQAIYRYLRTVPARESGSR